MFVVFPNAVNPTVIFGGKSHPVSANAISVRNYLDID